MVVLSAVVVVVVAVASSSSSLLSCFSSSSSTIHLPLLRAWSSDPLIARAQGSELQRAHARKAVLELLGAHTAPAEDELAGSAVPPPPRPAAAGPSWRNAALPALPLPVRHRVALLEQRPAKMCIAVQTVLLNECCAWFAQQAAAPAPLVAADPAAVAFDPFAPENTTDDAAPVAVAAAAPAWRNAALPALPLPAAAPTVAAAAPAWRRVALPALPLPVPEATPPPVAAGDGGGSGVPAVDGGGGGGEGAAEDTFWW